MDKRLSMDEGRQSFDPDGADFTMVLPNLRSQPFDQRPATSEGPRTSITPRQSPVKYPSAMGALGSPSSSRLRQPQIHSPKGSISRLPEPATQAGAEAVQIYEDPFSDAPTDECTAGPAKAVLEELPINERTNERASTPDLAAAPSLTHSTRSNEQNIAAGGDGPTTPSRTPRKAGGDAAGRPDAETLRARRLLASGIERIRARTLDAHGFRRVQDLVKAGGDIWGDDGARFADLLLALLGYLESGHGALAAAARPGAAASPAAAAALKTQVLATVRAMLALYRREAAPYAARALASVLAARRWERDSEHLSQEMERASEAIAATLEPAEGLAAVLEVVEAAGGPRSPRSDDADDDEEEASEDGARIGRTVVLGLAVLDRLLRDAKRKGVDLPPGMTQRLGQLAVRFLQDGDADVRRADLEFCLALHERFGGEGFWKAVVGFKEMHLNLITYYLARRGRA